MIQVAKFFFFFFHLKKSHPYQQNLGVSKNRGTPKWMVKIMENPIKTG